MRKIKLFTFCLLLIGGLSACSELHAFEDTRREAGQVRPVGQSRPNRIAVCYNPLWDNEEETLSIATEACIKQGKKKAVFDDRKHFNCRFMTPNTAFYTCQ